MKDKQKSAHAAIEYLAETLSTQSRESIDEFAVRTGIIGHDDDDSEAQHHQQGE